MIELKVDQLQALDAETQPVAAVDQRSGQIYRLIKEEVYEIVSGILKPYNRRWDPDDDLILRKVNTSDASVFAQKYGGSSQCWGVIWSIVSLVFMIAGIVAGIAAFPESFSQQENDSKHFIPTR